MIFRRWFSWKVVLADSCAIKNRSMSKVLRQICGSKLVLGGRIR